MKVDSETFTLQKEKPPKNRGFRMENLTKMIYGTF